MNIDEVLKTFVIESRELLEQMEAALLRIEQEPDDPDVINAIFRAAHTIKGSAGLFGLDFVVAFTHVAESVLDRMRDGALKVDGDLVMLLLSCCDHIGVLIDHVEEGRKPDDGASGHSQLLVDKLNVYLGCKTETHKPVGNVPVEHEHAFEKAGGGGTVGTDNWHLSLRFGVDVLRNGLDPLAFIRYLCTLGEIVHMATLADAVPKLSEINPELCYLGFEISFRSDADKASIEGAFEFVREDSIIRITPPRSRMSEYLRLIRELPEDEMKLGEILVKCGTLTASELEGVLREQAAEDKAHARPIGEVLVEQSMVQAPVVEAALEKQKQVKESKSNENSLIRVDSGKLDHLINLVGELIIIGSSASLIAQRAGMGDLLEVTSSMARMVEEVRDSALSLRMVQIGGTFNKFQRVVRDVSKELGKDIRLEIGGAETELDKTVVEKIGDPLTHLVRNSMDHGIEPAEVRVARGKPAHGTLRLNAFHDSGNIVIEVSDDGGGLNKERILKKAIERGIVQPDDKLSDQEIYQLIFEAGFSTAEAVSNLSGRGVGMDVVRRNITALRGSVEIDSSEGVGATMRIRLPLTLAIIDGFLVGVGDACYVVPLATVVECVELTAEETRDARGRDYLNLRGEVLPFIRLKQLFNVPDPAPRVFDEDDDEAMSGIAGRSMAAGGVTLTPEGMAALSADPELAFILNPVKRENVVVVQYAGRRAGLVVEKLLGEFQTVIKPLGRMFGSVGGIGGFTILGSGDVALILDVQRLIQQVGEREQRNVVGGGKSLAMGAT